MSGPSYINEPPFRQVDVPTYRSILRGDDDTIHEWWLDADMTRYHVIAASVYPKILIAIEPDEHHGRSWHVFERSAGPMAWSYVAEKLRIGDGDAPGLARLLSVVMDREIFYVPVDGALRSARYGVIV